MSKRSSSSSVSGPDEERKQPRLEGTHGSEDLRAVASQRPFSQVQPQLTHAPHHPRGGAVPWRLLSPPFPRTSSSDSDRVHLTNELISTLLAQEPSALQRLSMLVTEAETQRSLELSRQALLQQQLLQLAPQNDTSHLLSLLQAQAQSAHAPSVNHMASSLLQSTQGEARNVASSTAFALAFVQQQEAQKQQQLNLLLPGLFSAPQREVASTNFGLLSGLQQQQQQQQMRPELALEVASFISSLSSSPNAQQPQGAPPVNATGTTQSTEEPLPPPTRLRPPSTKGKYLELALPTDRDNLAEYQCLLRDQVYLFETTAEDLEAGAQGRNKPIRLGQVGVQCKHCAYLLPGHRPRGAVYYPARLAGIYQASQRQNMGEAFC